MRLRFVFKHAARELKANWKKNIFFTLSIFLGVAALVSVNSFSDNLKVSVEQQSKKLKGSDLSFSSTIPFTDSLNVISDSLVKVGMEKSTLTQFMSMVLNPKNDNSRLVQVKSISGNYPWYGELITEPADAWKTFQSGQNAILDDVLKIQLDIQLGDSIKLGETYFKVAGFLKKMPGESSFGFSGMGAKIYFPLQYLQSTNLVQIGSRIRYNYEYKATPTQDIAVLGDTLKSKIKSKDVRISTYLEREQQLGKSIDQVGNFLGLISMIALLLGGVGIASSINVYVRNKLDTIAILRCLGATAPEVTLAYLIISLAIGLFGILLGIFTGIGIQVLIPTMFAQFLPVELEFFISWNAVLQGLLVGVVITILFALFPLIKILKVSPLNALRRDVSSTIQSGSMKWLMTGLTVLFIGIILLLAISQAGSVQIGIFFTVGIFVALGVLFLIAWMTVKVTKLLRLKKLDYIIRQGISNLYRPNNQTVTLILALGFGVFLILTVYQVQNSLLSQMFEGNAQNRPNMVLFDIQKSQYAKLDSIFKTDKIDYTGLFPIIPARITSVNGGNPFGKADSARPFPVRREYQITYKSTLAHTEEVVSGKWFDETDKTPEASLEEGLARNLKINLGDTLNLNVLGVEKDVKVTSFRKVNWAGMNPNFMIVIKPGLLESAPQTFVTSVRINKPEDRVLFQRKIVKAFPNVMAIDLTVIIETVDSVLDKIGLIIRFMGIFSILTGLIVVIGAIANGRYQRLKESALLRTLGGTKRVILSIFSVEFLALGILSAFTGALLAYVSSKLLVEEVFQLTFFAGQIGFSIGIVSTVAIMLLLGWIINGSLLSKKPLEVLREE